MSAKFQADMRTISSSRYSSTCIVHERDDRIRFVLIKHQGYGQLKKNKKGAEVARFGQDTFEYSSKTFGLDYLENDFADLIAMNMFVEPCLNAEVHGHGYDPKYGIVLTSSLKNECDLQTMVSQHGGGFDHYKEMIEARMTHKDSGIASMLGFCDKIQWKKGGSDIYLLKSVEKYL